MNDNELTNDVPVNFVPSKNSAKHNNVLQNVYFCIFTKPRLYSYFIYICVCSSYRMYEKKPLDKDHNKHYILVPRQRT